VKYGLAVVVVNQVAANIHPAYSSANFFLSELMNRSDKDDDLKMGVSSSVKIASEFQDLRPSLGLFWSIQINSRLFLTKTAKNVRIRFDSSWKYQKNDENNETNTETSEKQSIKNHILRRLTVIFSPRLPPSSCFFFVTSKGIECLEELKDLLSP
jgi:hypothetical protein